MWTIIIAAGILLLGIGIGYWIGIYFIRKENTILKTQLQLLETHSQHWAKEAVNTNTLNRQVAEQQSQNTATVMKTFIQLLQSFQQKQTDNSNQEEKEKVEKIMNQVKDNFI